MLKVSLEEATNRLRDLVDAVLRGESVVIVKDYQKAVRLVPAISGGRRRFGSAKGLIIMAKDFDAPLSDFDAYMR